MRSLCPENVSLFPVVPHQCAFQIIDYNFLAYLTACIASFMPDYKRQKVEADAALARASAR